MCVQRKQYGHIYFAITASLEESTTMDPGWIPYNKLYGIWQTYAMYSHHGNIAKSKTNNLKKYSKYLKVIILDTYLPTLC